MGEKLEIPCCASHNIQDWQICQGGGETWWYGHLSPWSILRMRNCSSPSTLGVGMVRADGPVISRVGGIVPQIYYCPCIWHQYQPDGWCFRTQVIVGAWKEVINWVDLGFPCKALCLKVAASEYTGLGIYSVESWITKEGNKGPTKVAIFAVEPSLDVVIDGHLKMSYSISTSWREQNRQILSSYGVWGSALIHNWQEFTFFQLTERNPKAMWRRGIGRKFCS